MSRIPVFRTIGRAYGFTFANVGTIIGLIWLPAIMLVALQYYVALRYLNGYLSAAAQGNLYELNSATGLRYLSIAVVLFLQAVIAAPVMRQALGLRTGRAVVSFAIGPTTLLVFGALAALALVLMAIEYLALVPFIFVIMAAAFAAKAAGTFHGLSIALAAMLGAFLMLFCAMIFISVRLSFLLVPVTVAERRIDLIHAWRLTGSNFWRIFVVMIATLLPLGILHAALIWATLGFSLPHSFSPELLASWKGAPTKALTWFVQAFRVRMPFVFGVGLLLTPFWVGLSTGASAAAYRALTPPLENSGPTELPVPETSAA